MVEQVVQPARHRRKAYALARDLQRDADRMRDVRQRHFVRPRLPDALARTAKRLHNPQIARAKTRAVSHSASAAHRLAIAQQHDQPRARRKMGP